MSLIYQSPDVIIMPNSSSSSSGSIKRRPGLYLGGKVDAKNYDKLTKQWYVTHIVNVTPPKEVSMNAGVPNYFEKQQQNNNNNSNSTIKYKRIPIYDNESNASELLVAADTIVQFIATGLCYGSVLVHCHKGISRSTTAVLFYLMRRVGMTLKDGMALIKRRRPQANPIPAFITILQEYEQKCRSLGCIIDVDTNSNTNNKAQQQQQQPLKRPFQVAAALTGATNIAATKASIGPMIPTISSNKKSKQDEDDDTDQVVTKGEFQNKKDEHEEEQDFKVPKTVEHNNSGVDLRMTGKSNSYTPCELVVRNDCNKTENMLERSDGDSVPADDVSHKKKRIIGPTAVPAPCTSEKI